MAVVNVQVNGRPYQIACHDGQEEHVRKRAADFDQRVRDLGEAVGQVGDMLLLVMAGVLLTDELAEAKSQAAARKEPPVEDLDAALAAAVEALANRVDGIADRLRSA